MDYLFTCCYDILCLQPKKYINLHIGTEWKAKDPLTFGLAAYNLLNLIKKFQPVIHVMYNRCKVKD